MKLKIIIIIVVVLAIGVSGYFLFFSNKETEVEPEVVLYNFAIEDAFITNVRDSSMLFKTKIILVVNQAEMDEFLNENLYTMRDTILFILRGLTVEELSDMDIEDRLRQEIPSALNHLLEIDNIKSVYFSDFVMQ